MTTEGVINTVRHVNVINPNDEYDDDPVVGFHFAVDVGDAIKGFFTEVSGLGSETEIIEHKVINANGVEVTKKIPGRLKWEDITLKRGITRNLDLWVWRAQVENGAVEEARMNGTIIMFNQMLEPVASWSFERGWPSKITGPQPKADSNEVGIEEIVISHEYISRDSTPAAFSDGSTIQQSAAAAVGAAAAARSAGGGGGAAGG